MEVKLVCQPPINFKEEEVESMEAPGEEPAAKNLAHIRLKCGSILDKNPTVWCPVNSAKQKWRITAVHLQRMRHLKRKHAGALCEDSRKISPQVTVVFLFTFPAVYE